MTMKKKVNNLVYLMKKGGKTSDNTDYCGRSDQRKSHILQKKNEAVLIH